MKYEIYSIFDSKTKAFGTPFFQLNEEVAYRTSASLLTDGDSTVRKHPEDFSLFKVGEFDDDQGKIIPLATPECKFNFAAFKPEPSLSV